MTVAARSQMPIPLEGRSSADHPSSPLTPSRPHILFLTASQSDASPSNDIWNTELISALSPQTSTTLISYLDPSAANQLTPAYLAATYTHISLLLLGHYPAHYASLLSFLRYTLPIVRALNPEMKIYPGPNTALWNADKSYLAELRDAGFLVPRTVMVEPWRGIEGVRAVLKQFAEGEGKSDEDGEDGGLCWGSKGWRKRSVAVKPSVGASGVWTHCVQDPGRLGMDDEAFLEKFVAFAQGAAPEREGVGDDAAAAAAAAANDDDDRKSSFLGNILIQEYVKEIRNGEYSLCYIGGRHLYTILKLPRAGGWQVNSEHGGTFAVVSEVDVPLSAKQVAQYVVDWLQRVRFPVEELAYARIDGVMSDEKVFVLMEVELIEPSLYLGLEEQGVGRKGVEALCDIFARPSHHSG